MHDNIIKSYKKYLSCRESQPFYEPKVSRTSYSYTQGAFTFLYVEINKLEKETKINSAKKSKFILD